MNTVVMPSVETAKDYIYSIDFSKIIDKMVSEYGWNRKHVLLLCKMYRNFLFLHKKYGKQYTLPPSEEIDEFWHMHILDTQKYRQDCQAIFGEYKDHYPYFGLDDNTDFSDLADAFETTQKLYAQEFNGEYIQEVRNMYSKIAAFFRVLFKTRPTRSRVQQGFAS